MSRRSAARRFAGEESELSYRRVRVPEGFCVTADAYYYFLNQTGLKGFVAKTLNGLDTRNLGDLSDEARRFAKPYMRRLSAGFRK